MFTIKKGLTAHLTSVHVWYRLFIFVYIQIHINLLENEIQKAIKIVLFQIHMQITRQFYHLDLRNITYVPVFYRGNKIWLQVYVRMN